MRSRFLIGLPFLALPLLAQPVLRTEYRGGVERAVVRHADTGDSVTDEHPAVPGELLVAYGSGITVDTALYIGENQVETSQLDDERVQFTLPESATGGFVSVSLRSADGQSNAATLAAAADPVQLSQAEVLQLIKTAANAIDDPKMAVAVVDRAGRPLGIFARSQASRADIERALSLARTGAFFSHNQAPLSSRTVYNLSTEHFPEINGINNQAAALFGIELTNRGCRLSDQYNPGKEIPRSRNIYGKDTGLGVTTIPGGIPLFRASAAGANEIGVLIGGIGVAGLDDPTASNPYSKVERYNPNEFAAFEAVKTGFLPGPIPEPGAVFVDGIRLEFVNQTARPAGTRAGSLGDDDIRAGLITDEDGNPTGVKDGAAIADGYLVEPRDGNGLSATDVRNIIERTLDRARRTRAVIRLPLGSRARFVIAVSDLDGNILGMFRMPDSTVFSIDVAATKARNVVYFAGQNVDSRDWPADLPKGVAITNRTIGFGAQNYFPSGVLNTGPGPFRDVYLYDRDHPCTQGRQPENPNQSGIVFFPGSAPLYKDGKLIGGLGVSGDGVEQDDYATSGGISTYEPNPKNRADQYYVRGVRMPYFKFPRNPEQ